MDTAAAIALAKVLEQIGTWPLGLLLTMILIAPWVVLISVSRSQEKRFDAQEKQLEAVVQMYKDNVTLVKAYEKLSDNHQDLVIMNTEAITRLIGIIKTLKRG